MSDLIKSRLSAGGLPIWNAVFCLDCEGINNSQAGECPVCNGRSLVRLARMLGGSLFAHREQLAQEGEHAFFDVTITVELRQMDAKALTTTLERLTSVIGPKLAREQAMFHVDVKPLPDRLRSQGVLRFPERNAA